MKKFDLHFLYNFFKNCPLEYTPFGTALVFGGQNDNSTFMSKNFS